MPAIKGAVRRSQLVTTYGVGVDRRARRRVVHGRGDRPLGRQRARTCTSPPRARASGPTGSSCRRRRDGARHPGRPVPALVLVPEVQAPRRPPPADDLRVERLRRLQPHARPVALRDGLPTRPHRRLPVHAVGARGKAGEGTRTRCASRHAARPRRFATSTSSAAAEPSARWTRRSTDSRFATSRRCFGNGRGSGESRRSATSPFAPSSAVRRTSGSGATDRSSRSLPGPTRPSSCSTGIGTSCGRCRAVALAAGDRGDRDSTAGTNFTTDDLVEAVQERKRRQEGAPARPPRRRSDATSTARSAPDRRTRPEASSQRTRPRSPASLERRRSAR